jgi:hypothetical protein
MVIRFKVPFDNGTVKCAEGESTSELSPSYAARLVKAGLAEVVAGNRGVNVVRAEMGLPPIASMSMTKDELLDMAGERGVAVETDDNKADLVAKINAAARND